MIRPRLFYVLILACSVLTLGSLALLSSPASAQLPSGPGSASAPSARETLKSDLGLPFGPKQRLVDQAYSAVPGNNSTAKAGTNEQNPLETCWNLVASPSPSGGAGFTVLYGVAAVSSNDVWAVGNNCIDCGTISETQHTLIEHWNGHRWSVVPSPNRGTSDNFLNAVVAFSQRNAWAMGHSWDGTRFQTLILHWDGSSWSIVSSPNPGPRNNYLFAAAATSPNDIWAVGTYRILGGPLVELIEHYNGHTWSVVSGSSTGTGRNVLYGVTALSSNNVWAAGIACDDNGCTQNPRGLIEHWDGHAWSVVPSPNPGAGVTFYEGISASKANDVWAAGYYCVDTACAVADLVVEHYNGHTWSIASTHPFPGSEFSAYWGVLALSKNDVWLPGSYSADGVTWTNLLRHWDGRNWSNVPVSSPGAFNNDLRAITAVGGDDNRDNNNQDNEMWAVGDYDAGVDQPLGYTQVQHSDGDCH
jgi:hypothetical protein